MREAWSTQNDCDYYEGKVSREDDFFFEEDFQSWLRAAFHFLPSQFGYLSDPEAAFSSPSPAHDPFTLYWDLSYVLVLQETVQKYQMHTSDSGDEKIYPFILITDDESEDEWDGQGVVTHLKINDTVWEKDSRGFKSFFDDNDLKERIEEEAGKPICKDEPKCHYYYPRHCEEFGHPVRWRDVAVGEASAEGVQTLIEAVRKVVLEVEMKIRKTREDDEVEADADRRTEEGASAEDENGGGDRSEDREETGGEEVDIEGASNHDANGEDGSGDDQEDSHDDHVSNDDEDDFVDESDIASNASNESFHTWKDTPTTTPILKSPLSRLPLLPEDCRFSKHDHLEPPTYSTVPFPHLANLHRLIPPPIHNWSRIISGKCCHNDGFHEEEEADKYGRFLQSVMMGVVVGAGMDVRTLQQWDPSIDGYSPLVMWGRRRNSSRRVVGFVGMVANSS
ncbi:hypothetical protein HDV00_000439 [Rhizophlyctis rosea]|nr:hypothetical protein HDV00_000439 [Rhizophlyctis rosea]